MMNRFIYKRHFNKFIFLVFLISISCRQGNFKSESVPVDLKIKRFEQDLFSVSVYGLADSIPYLLEKYPKFLPLFSYRIIEIGGPGDPGYAGRLIDFVSEFTIYNLNKRVKEVFPSVEMIEEQLSGAFGYYASAFPEKNIPEIITCISGFNQSIVVTDSILAISLDKYLGSEDDFYKLLYPPVPEYSRYTMHPAQITSDAMRAWLTTEFSYNDSKDNLLSRMIFEGRAVYAVSKLIPGISDTLLWGYKIDQLEFCRKNEKQMWTYLVENKLLFNSDNFLISQFVSDAPFTKDFSKDSPGRAVVWVAFQIIERYLENNPGVTLSQLMTETDYLKILNLSKYNP